MLDAASSRIGQSPVATTTNKEDKNLFTVYLAKDGFLGDLHTPFIDKEI